MNSTSKENRYRNQVVEFIKQTIEAKSWLKGHKLSLGTYGEFLLMETFTKILKDRYEICQGFVVEDVGIRWISNQCDIIVYKKGGVIRSFGYTKLIDVKFVVAIIEVKTSITEKTFHTTLKSFERLAAKGVKNTFLFVYGRFSKNSLTKWLFSYKLILTDDGLIRDVTIFDWTDKEWLPNGIASLYNNAFYSLSHAQFNNGDWIGYLSYNNLDKENKIISSLQEFFQGVLHSIDIDSKINLEHYSIKNGIPLFTM